MVLEVTDLLNAGCSLFRVYSDKSEYWVRYSDIGGAGDDHLQIEIAQIVGTASATHLRYRVRGGTTA